jgi:putative transposase
MRSVQFSNSNFYHIYNRGVDKRVIFQDKADFKRFYASLYLFNDSSYSHSGDRSPLRAHDLFNRLLKTEKRGSCLVNVVSYCLLPNHYHLLLEQMEERGINKFMHKLGMGYSNYFNKRYERSGRLFEGPFKAKLIQRDEHFIHMPRYIHLNALDMTSLKWREGKISDWNEADAFLDSYQWSSHRVYKGLKESLPIVKQPSVGTLFSSVDDYTNFLRQWTGRYSYE